MPARTNRAVTGIISVFLSFLSVRYCVESAPTSAFISLDTSFVSLATEGALSARDTRDALDRLPALLSVGQRALFPTTRLRAKITDRRKYLTVAIASLLPLERCGASGNSQEGNAGKVFEEGAAPPPLQQADGAFRSGGYGLEEYSNAFVASRDTNISPKEAYDSISSSLLLPPLRSARSARRAPRALDLGAGAGVSTQILYEMGYTTIDAIDWSRSAWDRFVSEDPGGRCPPSVAFYEMDDERYRRRWRREGAGKFDLIVYNFSVNENKAKEYAREMLVDGGLLLAPVNIQKDYWLKQAYRLYDPSGKVLWQAAEVGAWSVTFQPDVTQDTCQGIWCAPFNGFKKIQ